MSVVSGDESLPRLYANSSISYDQIPVEEGKVTGFLPFQPYACYCQVIVLLRCLFSGYVKRAAALGRYLQNPLAMVANLCAPSRKVLSWKLSPLESFLNADEKYAMVEQIMVDVTNQVGIDLNLAANHDWLFAPMQFISGLGPRKAAALERSLSGAREIVSRKELLTHGLGTKVYYSAAGFLRIRRCGLDDTRIHPESYILAQEIVKYIYKKFVSDDNLGDDVSIEMAIKNLRDDLSAWKAFDVDAYAKDTNCLSKAKTLRAIKLELIQGFQDWRKPYEEPKQDEEFFMIYGANVTVDVGQTVKATVRNVKAELAICELESGLTGMLLREDCSDDWRDVDLTGKLHEGDTLTCKIKSFRKTWYLVYLTCRENDMRNIGHQNVENLDPYYHEDRSSLSSEQDKARRGKELAEYNS